jgi:hypothetical protein
MALDTYDGLKGEIADFLNRQSLTAKIPTFVRLLEARVERTQRTRQMVLRAYADTLSSVTDGTASEYLPLPGDYLQLVRVRVINATSAQEPMSYASMSDIDRMQAQQSPGVPTRYNIVGASLRLGPFPDTQYRIEIVYYAKLPKLTSANTRNWLLADHPDIYLYGSLDAASKYLKDDERVPMWKATADEMLEDLRVANERAEKAGQPMKARLQSTYG